MSVQASLAEAAPGDFGGSGDYWPTKGAAVPS